MDIKQIVKQLNKEIKSATEEELDAIDDSIEELIEKLKILQQNVDRRREVLEEQGGMALCPTLVVGNFKIVEYADCFDCFLVGGQKDKRIKTVDKKVYDYLGSADAMRNSPVVQEIIASLK